MVSEQRVVPHEQRCRVFPRCTAEEDSSNHNQFYLFARQVVQIIDESKTRLEEERLHPKERLRGAAVRRKINTLIENYNRGPPLALPLKTLMKAIYDALHEHVSFEDAFECEPDGAVDDTSEVAMDIIDE